MSGKVLLLRGVNEAVMGGVADLDELRLVGIGDIEDRSGIYVASENSLYFYDYTSVEADDAVDVIEPTAGAGRWKRHAYGATSSDSTLYRRRWYQERVVPADVTATIPADAELLVRDIDVEGTLDVVGDLVVYDDSPPKRPTWSQPMTVEADTGESIPAGSQLIVADTLTVDGHLDVRGDLIFLTL